MKDDEIIDALSCGEPSDAWEAVATQYMVRSQENYAIAEELRRKAKDAHDSAVEHTRRAEAFKCMAASMENNRPPM